MSRPFPLPTHLSASSIRDWLACPLLWYGRRVAKWPEPPSADLAIGTAVHAAFAAHHRGDDAELALLEAWGRNPCGLEMPRGALQRAVDALRLYREANPAEGADRADFKLSWEVPGVPARLVGYLDLLRAGVIVEQKTTRWPRWWTQRRADAELQATAYWDGYAQLIGQPPRKVVYWIVQTAPRAAVARLETRRTGREVEAFHETVRGAYAEMAKGELRRGCKDGACRWPERCAELAGAPAGLCGADGAGAPGGLARGGVALFGEGAARGSGGVSGRFGGVAGA